MKAPTLMKKFYGRAIDQMPKVFAAGLRPATVEEILLGRMQGTFSEDEWYDSSVLTFTDPKGYVKFALYDEELLKGLIHPQANVVCGAIERNEENAHLFDAFPDDKVLSPREIKQHVNKFPPLVESKNNSVWKILFPSEMRENLLEYAALLHENNNYECTSLWFSSAREAAAVRLVGINLKFKSFDTYSCDHIGNFDGCLAGIAPEAQRPVHFSDAYRGFAYKQQPLVSVRKPETSTGLVEKIKNWFYEEKK